MEMTTEMVGGAIDDAMEDEADEEETEQLVGQVLAEIVSKFYPPKPCKVHFLSNLLYLYTLRSTGTRFVRKYY